MFSAILIKDNITIAPTKFDRSRLQVLMEQINLKYANKVIPHVGLCIRLLKIESVGEAQVFPSDGSAICEVSFVMIVFKPFVGEVLQGRIKSCNAEEIRVSIGFFEDVIIPAHLLPADTQFNEAEQIFVWNYDGQKFHFDLGADVRFRVQQLRFTTVKKTAKGTIATTTESAAAEESKQPEAGAVPAPPPLRTRLRSRSLSMDISDAADAAPSAMVLVGSFNDMGLGSVEWWAGA